VKATENDGHVNVIAVKAICRQM